MVVGLSLIANKIYFNYLMYKYYGGLSEEEVEVKFQKSLDRCAQKREAIANLQKAKRE